MTESFSSAITEPPSSFLPRIKSLSSHISNCHEYLAYLRHIYVPNVRGSRRRRPQKDGQILTNSQSSALAEIRRDSFERAYALRWLSALIRLTTDSDVDAGLGSEAQDEAAALLAICAGTAAAGSIQRQLEFGDGRITITLKDVPLSTNASHTDYFSSVGAQTWGGAFVLAEEIARDPNTFFPDDSRHRELRVLELGAGTGLVGLVAGKVAQINGRRVKIVATDYYPSVLDNLKANIEVNFPTLSDSNLSISSHVLDWSSFPSEHSVSAPSPDDTDYVSSPFDLILGADIIYEPDHATWIRNVLLKLLRRPEDSNSDRGGLFHLVVPLRPSFAAESSTIEQVFKFSSEVQLEGHRDELVILSREIIICDADADEDDDGEGAEVISNTSDASPTDGNNVVRYAYYTIGWNVGGRDGGGNE